MQIQRIQTLWLIVALACMVAFMFIPFGTISIAGAGEAMLYPYDLWGVVIPAALAVLFLLVAVFSYKNLPVQRREVVLSAMMELVTAGVALYVLFDSATEGSIGRGWSVALVGVAFVFTLLAIVGINRDSKLLRSYDRLR